MRNELMRSGLKPESDSLLIIGASADDLDVARELGFRSITCSNLEQPEYLSLDAEDMALADNSFDVVFAHAVLHHCMSPHKAALESLRVARKAFMFLEGNDSMLMRAAILFGAHNPYEVTAVIANQYRCGGVRNGPIPNYVYRWSRRCLEQTVYSGFPHLDLDVRIVKFFDFCLTADELAIRRELPIRVFRGICGAKTAIVILRSLQRLLNVIPVIHSQGNHFFALISKHGYKPWIEASEEHVGLKRVANGAHQASL
jgi:SAM-dependent methyltransferase